MDDDSLNTRIEDHLKTMSASLQELVATNKDTKIASTLTSQIAVVGNTKLMTLISLAEKLIPDLNKAYPSHIGRNSTKLGKFI